MTRLLLLTVLSACIFGQLKSAQAQETLKLHPGDKVVVLGNTFAERMQSFNNWETLLHSRFPKEKLTVRNLGYAADTITVRLRSENFQDHGHTLVDHQPNVIIACFGFNESFAGPAGLPAFERDLAQFLADLKELKYPTQYYPNGRTEPVVQDKTGEIKQVPTVVLVSPIANEDLPERNILAATRNNKNIELYTAAMKKVADAAHVQFVDLYTGSKKLLDNPDTNLTFNGCHLTDEGDAAVAELLDQGLFGTATTPSGDLAASIKKELHEKNKQFFYDYRAVNGFYIYGGRKNPFGVVNFPAEFAKLRKMVEVRDERVWKAAAGETLPEAIDDSKTGEFTPIETNFKEEVKIIPPEESAKMFTLADGFQVNLFASEVEFPDLENPVSFTFDAKGRLWVTTNNSYPQYLPGTPVNDKVLILTDTDGDGKADEQKIFADNLYLPIGIELGDHGAYVSQQPNLVHLKDADGDDRAESMETVLQGFDSADSHHSISAFEMGPGGELYFQEGTFHHTQVESPYGPKRVANAAVFRYDPKPEKFDVYVSYPFANPWGHTFDRWGQNFVADASGGANYFAAAFSGDLDHPRKHPGLKEFFTKQWRPTCGCEIVSSRHFPKEMQGDYLLNNCIGFQGVLQYRMREEGSGYAADPVTPLLRSSDYNFRPVDIQFGPDGALYILDWYNPLVGHMQHSIRDPNRSKTHGRIWRITHTQNPLVTPAVIAGEPVAKLLDLLKVYEDRTRYRVRQELRDRDTAEVLAAVDTWIAGLDKSDDEYEHNLLEAFWVKQHHDVLDEKLLKQLLSAKDGRARAAAVRALCYAKDRIENPLALLQVAVNDEHPRVRLEAVRALSFFDNQEALDMTVESLLYDQDDYLEYTLKETQETLQRRIDAASKAAAEDAK
ncbi:PVC-type heme-binding CxxCH protein [Planctomicrobium sp. SH661]|uniref:PVC-type heme-binding CxxCH protein n=1 Tax=Planctomicrobium sp. SH661 TaxID=3448124 RepID=UPI003F5B5AB9